RPSAGTDRPRVPGKPVWARADQWWRAARWPAPYPTRLRRRRIDRWPAGSVRGASGDPGCFAGGPGKWWKQSWAYRDPLAFAQVVVGFAANDLLGEAWHSVRSYYTLLVVCQWQNIRKYWCNCCTLGTIPLHGGGRYF